MLTKVFACILKLIAAIDIETGAAVKNRTRHHFIIVFISMILVCLKTYHYILYYLPETIVISLDMILILIGQSVVILIIVVITLNPVLKFKKIVRVYKLGVSIANLVMPFKNNSLVDKSFIYHVFAKFTIDVLLFWIYIVMSFTIDDVPVMVGFEVIMFSFVYLTFFNASNKHNHR